MRQSNGKQRMSRGGIGHGLLERLETLIHDRSVRHARMSRDLEEEVRRRMDAERAQSVLTEVLQYSDYALIGKTLDGTITSWNASAQAMFGYSSEEAVGKHITLLFPPDRMGEEEIILRNVQEQGIVENYQTKRLRKDGRIIDVAVTVFPIRDAAGNIVGLSSLKRNITHRLEVESILKDYMQRLERSNRELEDFTFAASHDLQEPLRKIQVFGDLLQSKFGTVLGREGSDYLLRMMGAANRMSILLKALQEYSGISSPSPPFQPTHLDEVVRGSLREIRVAIEKAGVRIKIIGDLPVIEADPSQIRVLVQTLVLNSIKFQQVGRKPEVKIYGSVEGAACKLFIEDNGIGFDQSYAERIFRPFQRLHPKNGYDGVGVGLAICRKIVERHGGSITAESTPGKGATFIISLPVGHPEPALIWPTGGVTPLNSQ